MLVHSSQFCRPPQSAVTRLPHGPYPVSYIHIRAGSHAGTPHTVPNTVMVPPLLIRPLSGRVRARDRRISISPGRQPREA